MRILAIDQSSDPNVVAVISNASDVHTLGWRPEFRNNQELFKRLLAVVTEAGLGFDELDAFAVGLGPGSFTGVRCSVAAVRALAMPGAVPVVGIPSADVVARQVAAQTDAQHVVVAGDARRGRIWHAQYACRAGVPERTGEIGLVRCTEFADHVPQNATVASPDFTRLRDTLEGLCRAQVLGEAITPRADVLAEMARAALERGEALPAPVPIYLHPPVFVEPRFAVSN